MHDSRGIIDELIHLREVVLRKSDDMSFTKYSPSFVFTTENISGYLNQMDVNGKDLLVPCASGDHALEALSKGANSVDMFDINVYAYHMVQLKAAAIKQLSRAEFFEFFFQENIGFSNNDDILSKKVYLNKIRQVLPIYSRNFWDQVYKLFKNGKTVYYSSLLINGNGNSEAYIKLLDYLKNDNFELLKEKIYKLDEKHANYFNFNVIELPIVLEKKYDLVLLSNIQDYIKYTYGKGVDQILQKYRHFIDTDLSRFLKDDGKIVSEYYYYYNSDIDAKPGKEHTILEVPPVYNIIDNENSYFKDAVMVYQKKKK